LRIAKVKQTTTNGIDSTWTRVDREARALQAVSHFDWDDYVFSLAELLCPALKRVSVVGKQPQLRTVYRTAVSFISFGSATLYMK
ncbi:MAG: hypothetical protein MZV70_63765, partial [Desulfobacterales bacterium]|nr:hypothetical protein [Desulfobacterales bacterium]